MVVMAKRVAATAWAYSDTPLQLIPAGVSGHEGIRRHVGLCAYQTPVDLLRSGLCHGLLRPGCTPAKR